MHSRKEQQAELWIQFGELIAPLTGLVAHPDQQTPQTRARACAQFTHDRTVFTQALNAFTNGEPGHTYAVERAQVDGHLNRFTNRLVSFRDDTEKLAAELQMLRRTATQNILAIPCELGSEILEAGSPFTAFVKLRSLCETASQQLVFVDPYMNQSAVRRYFNHASTAVSVTVITRQRGGQEFSDFIDVSRLYADERGTSRYRLLYYPDLHDRYLQCDDSVYHLGGSLKDAGRKSEYTVTRIQRAADAAATVDNLVQESDEAFGPSNPNHPTQ